MFTKTVFSLFFLFTFHIILGQDFSKSLYFETGKYHLNKSSTKILDSIAEKARLWPSCEIVITGHTDSIASGEYNMLLSDKRAQQAADYLISIGISPDNISRFAYGELKPSANNGNENSRALNRRVVISVYREKRTAVKSQTEKESEKTKSAAFENDTVIICRNGTKIEIPAGTFFPKKLKEVNLNIKEFNTNCDLTGNNIRMVTDSGDCLSSGGMVLMKPTVDTMEIKPNFGYRIRISIPAYHNVIDKDMKVFVANEKNGEIKWTLTKIEIQKDNERGMYYYVFDTDEIRGYNIDKTIQVRCEENGPLVKVRGFSNTDAYMTYPDEMYLSKGLPIGKKTFSLVKPADNKIPKLTVMAYNGPYTYIASGPLPELRYRKKKNMYIVSKKYFRLMGGPDKPPQTAKELLCESLNQ